MEDVEALKQQLEELRREHRDLDEKISSLALESPHHSFEINRLKKRKLQLKDMVVRIENYLLPDIIA